jgi:hypothetical protein
VKSAKYTSDITALDMFELKQAGCSNQEVLAVCQYVSYLAAVKRMANVTNRNER